MPRPLVRVVRAAVIAALAVSLAGCTGAPTPTPTPTSSPTPLGDGVLKIGTLFPSSGGVRFIGPAQVAGVKAAVRAINAAGGVNGTPVVVVSRDSGDASTKKVEESFAALVEKDVDVIIGPSSSVLAQRLLELAADAGIPLISPAATYPQLSTLDEEGIFFRTIATYPHQAVVFASLFADSESDIDSVAIVVRDDEASGSLAAALNASLQAVGIELDALEVAADADADEVAAAVASVKEIAPDAVVLATPDNGRQTKALITQLTAAGFGGTKLWLTSQNVADYSQALKPGLLKGVNGLLDGAEADAAFRAAIKKEDPGVALYRYAAEAYDATVLAALAAELAGDDGGPAVTAMLRDASIGGIKCTSFGECLDVLRTQPDIDYDGISGSVNLDGEGDPKRGTYIVVAYDAKNKYKRTAIVVG
jgi:ABC-type branched-subunit amino acid transport system substrate-binding protein